MRLPNIPFRYFNSSPEIIRLVVMMYVRYPLSLRNVEDLLFERGIDICHETVRFWWNRFTHYNGHVADLLEAGDALNIFVEGDLVHSVPVGNSLGMSAVFRECAEGVVE